MRGSDGSYGFTEHTHIVPADLPPGIGAVAHRHSDAIRPESDAHLLPLKEGLAGPEKLLIQRALAHHDGNRKRTAATLGINRSTLFNKMRNYDLL